MSYKNHRSIPVQVHGSPGQAEVYRTQLKMVRRKKGKSLTDRAHEIRRLMVMAFPGHADRTTDTVAKGVFIEALEDPDLVIQIKAQRSADFDTAMQVAQHMEAIINLLTSKSSKPVRAVLQGTGVSRVEAEGREGWSEAFAEFVAAALGALRGSDGNSARRERYPEVVSKRRRGAGNAGD